VIQLCYRISLAIFVVASVLDLCSAATVNAQQIVIPPPPSAPESTEAPSSAEAVITPGFWIVGSHGSPQTFDESAPVFCPSVTRYDHCAGFRRTDMRELTESILPGVPVCIFCHGSFVGWDDVLAESRETWKWVHHACPRQPIQMIYFSWPSDRPAFSPIVQFDVNRLGRRAGRNGFYMASLCQQIPAECPICLMGHSHGTRVITSSLHLIAGGEVEGYVLAPGPFPRHRIRAVFAASAMDHNWMNPGYRYDRALCPVECVLNLQNKSDTALFVYPLRRPFSGGALGYTGVTRKDRRQLGPYGHKIQDLNLTESIGVSHYWPNYFRRPWLAQAIRNYLFFDELTTYQSADAGATPEVDLSPVVESRQG
jgi:hypothetical protein